MTKDNLKAFLQLAYKEKICKNSKEIDPSERDWESIFVGLYDEAFKLESECT